MVSAEDVLFVARTIYFFLAAYFANAAPVILGGGAPLDGGRVWRDGKPLLGSHKTVRGTVSGILVGTVTGLFQGDPLRGFLLGSGSVAGDLLNSFVKRRINLKPGAPFPVFDQLSFIVFAIALVSLVPPPPSTDMIAVILIATLPIHFLSNLFSFLLKLKTKPW